MVNKQIVIFGTSSFAELAYEYFTHDSNLKVVAFTVDKSHMKETSKFNLPIVEFEYVEDIYDPNFHKMFIAVGYGDNLKLREKKFYEARDKGYEMATYISSKASVWNNVIVGEGCFIMEGNTIQPFIKIGENTTIWANSHVGHHSVIGSHNLITSEVCICGHVTIGNNCFFGVNSTVINNINVPDSTFIKANSLYKEGHTWKRDKEDNRLNLTKPYYRDILGHEWILNFDDYTTGYSKCINCNVCSDESEAKENCLK